MQTLSPHRSWLWLAGLTLGILTLAYQFMLPVRVDIGSQGDEPFLHGFYFAEQQNNSSFRWSSEQGEIALNTIGQRPWRLRIRANGMRPIGPLAVHIDANGHLPVTQAWGGEMAVHELTIPPSVVGVEGNLWLTLSAEPFVAPPDTRALGIMVDWVELEPWGWAFTLPSWIVLVVSLSAVLLCNNAVCSLTGSLRWAFLASLLLLAALAVSVIIARLQLSIYLPWLLLGSALLWLFGVRVRHATWWEWLLMALLAGLAVRFCSRALEFYRNGLPPGDFMIYFNAAKNLRIGAPLYDFVAAQGIPLGPVYKYPPLFAILLAPFTVFPARAVAANWFLLSLGSLAVSGYLLVRMQPEQQNTRSVAGAYLSAIVLLAFQPAWESLIRGQLDSEILVTIVIALVLLQSRRVEWLAGAVLALATMLKLYPGLLLVYLIIRRRWLALAGFAGATGGFILFSALFVGWPTLWRYASEILSAQTAAVPWPENQSYNGFLSRLIIPASATTWLTLAPFPLWTEFAFYLVNAVTFGLTVGLLWIGGRQDARHFRLAYAAAMPLIILMWPLAWIHYQTLLLLPLWLLALDQLQPGRRSWLLIAGLLISFLLIALGNEYTVMIPALQQGWPRLLQSYKLYGVVLLWILLLLSARQAKD